MCNTVFTNGLQMFSFIRNVRKTDRMDCHRAAILKPAFILFVSNTILLTETNDMYPSETRRLV